jgi:hypothetical protein
MPYGNPMGYMQGLGGFDPQMLQQVMRRMGGVMSGMNPTGFGVQNVANMRPGGFSNIVGGISQPQGGGFQNQSQKPGGFMSRIAMNPNTNGQMDRGPLSRMGPNQLRRAGY